MSYKVAAEYSNDQCSYDQETENSPNKKVKKSGVKVQKSKETPQGGSKLTKEPVSELVKEYQKAVGESLLKVCETLIFYGKKFSKIKDDDKKQYKRYKSEDKSVELARMWWDESECDPVEEEVVVPDNIKTLLTVIGFDLGLTIVKKAPFIKGEDNADELLRIATEEPDGLKHQHILKATKDPQDISKDDVVDMGDDGKGVVIEVTDTSVTAISFKDGAEVSEDIYSIIGKLKKVPPPKVGQWVQFANYLHPLWGKVGVLIKVDPEKININDEQIIVGIAERLCTVAVLLDNGVIAEVEVALNQIVKAKSEESYPAALTDVIAKLNRKVDSLVDAGAVDITQTPQWQQLELRLEYAEKNAQTSQAERDYIQKIAEENVKKHLVEVEGWIDPVTAEELKQAAEAGDTNKVFALENELNSIKVEKQSIEQRLAEVEESHNVIIAKLQKRDVFTGDAEVRVEAQAAKIRELESVTIYQAEALHTTQTKLKETLAKLADLSQLPSVKITKESVFSVVKSLSESISQKEPVAVTA